MDEEIDEALAAGSQAAAFAASKMQPTVYSPEFKLAAVQEFMARGEGGSLWLLQKRLPSGRFQWPSSGSLSAIGLLQMQWLLDGPCQIAAMEGRAKASNPFLD